MRLAVIADIHGNLPALEAVTADIHLHAPDIIVTLGDQVNRCPWSNEVMDIVADQQWPRTLAGNHEIILLKMKTNLEPTHPIFTNRRRFADLWWTWAKLDPRHFKQMADLPHELRLDLDNVPPIRLLHGLRDNPFAGITIDYSNAQIDLALDGIEEQVVLTAHTHWPLMRKTSRYTVLNPGSVGMPYNGDPRAQYMILDADRGSWQPTLRSVDYDQQQVHLAFDTHGLFKAYGPVAQLYLNTIDSGEPWVSDFMYWLRRQPIERQMDIELATADYLATHGPGQWAFALK